MGTVALTNINRLSIGGAEKIVSMDVTFSSSYATNGDTIDTSQIPINTISRMSFSSHAGAATSFGFDGTSKIKAYAGSSEVSNATNLSGVTVKALVFGR